jgi:hypothetical protein
MESDQDYSWLASPIHKNVIKNLKFNWQEDPAIMESLKMSFEGSIVAVLTSKVKTQLSDPEILRRRMGFAKMPKTFKVEDMNEFYTYLAHHIEIAEE